MARTILRKISTTVPKSMLDAVRIALITDKTARIFVCRVAGIALATKENNHPLYGLSYALVGSFRKVNPDGTEEDAPVLWTNESVVLPVKAALDNGAPSVQVMVDIYAVYAEKGATGFQYVLEVHGQEDEDPVSKLLKAAPAMLQLTDENKAEIAEVKAAADADAAVKTAAAAAELVKKSAAAKASKG